MPEQQALLTVGDLRKALARFPDDQPIRIALRENMPIDGATAFQLAANVHEWGLLNNDIWSDGCDTHRCVNISVLAAGGEGCEDERVPHEPDKKFLVERSEDDPDGEGDYF